MYGISYNDTMIPTDTIEAFDTFLNEHGINFECVVVGGAALGLLGIISRHTKTIHTLGRLDLLRSKLFALCDRGIDIPDCVALAPTDDEIKIIRPWLEQRDAHPHWPDHVRATLEDLQERLADGI